MKIVLLCSSAYLFVLGSHAQEHVGVKDVFEAIETCDTITVIKYFEAGGSIDAEATLQTKVSAKSNRKKGVAVNLFEYAIQKLGSVQSNNSASLIPFAYANLNILLSHIDESQHRQELLDRTFSLSIATNDIELVRRIAQMGADINHQCHVCFGRTPLLIAIMYNQNFELIKFLFSLKPDLSLLDNDGRCCVHYGAFSGNVELMDYLIKTSGIDINVKDKFGETPLYYAADLANIEVYNYLLEKGARVDFKTSSNKTILHAAAGTGNVDFFRHVYYTSGLSLWNGNLFRPDPYFYADSEEIELFIKRTSLLEFGDKYLKKKLRKVAVHRIFS